MLPLGCGRVAFDTLFDAASGDAFNLLNDAPAGSTIVSFGEATGTTYPTRTDDTYLSQALPNQNYGISTTFSVGGQLNALLHFDLSPLPTGTVVLGAELHLYTEAVSNSYSISAGTIREAWMQGTRDGSGGTPNWNDRAPSTPWTTPGADSLEPTVLALMTPKDPSVVTVAEFLPGGITEVQNWVSSPSTNFGMKIDDFAGPTIFASSQSTTPERRPVLVLAIR